MHKEALKFLDAVKRNDTITVFRHISPDPDAQGSQWGIISWIQENFPDKTVVACSLEDGIYTDFFPKKCEVCDELIKKSLAIVTDTSNKERVDDQRYRLAKETFRIDHHIFVEKFCDEEIIVSEAGAACEIVARIFEELDMPCSTKTAEYLYAGLIMDTLNFKTGNTTSKTFKAASYLADKGIDLAKINSAMLNVNKNVFDYITFLRKKMVYRPEGVAYAFISKEDYEPFGLTNAEARSKVHAFDSVKEFKIWCLFTENTDKNDIRWVGSLRSRSLVINEIAGRYHGGGHANACGIKLYNQQEADALIEELAKLAASDAN